MKRILTYLVVSALTLTHLVSCKKDNPELGDPPTAADAVFTYEASPESDNKLVFTASNTDVIAVWDFGNGTTAKGTTATGVYPKKGVYTVKLTVFTRGGSASSTQDINIENDDLTLLDDPIFNFLTGGSDNGGSKTWVMDYKQDAHFGVGPNPSGAAGDYPEYYAAAAFEKEGGGMYDDLYTFHLDAFKFDMVTNGDVYINSNESGNFPGSYEASVGDYTAPYDDRIGSTWSVSSEDDTLLTIGGDAFMGYYTGVNTYEIIHISDDELFLRYEDANAPDLAWYIRLVPEGSDTTTGGGGGGGDTNSVGYSLPIDFEVDEPEFTAFGNSTDTVIDNPHPGGINTSSRVLETVHGSETWAGIFVDLGDKLDFSTATNIEVKVWAPGTGEFLVKLESQASSSTFIEKTVNVTEANTWVQLSVDFSDADAGLYDRLVVFPGWGVANAGTFYLDDFEQN